MNDKIVSGLPSDGREKDEYETKYPDNIVRWQWIEATYIFVLMMGAFVIIFLNLFDVITVSKSIDYEKKTMIINLVYCMASGLLGGATFGMKILYKSVASKMWNEDRRFWRILSPVISISLAFVMGIIFFNQTDIVTAEYAILIGFFAGYFSDEAAGKMYEVANVIFGTTKANNYKC